MSSLTDVKDFHICSYLFQINNNVVVDLHIPCKNHCNMEQRLTQPDPADIVRVEKNLNSLGFFTATYKRQLKTPVRSIECGFREVDGKRTVQKAHIEGTALVLVSPSGADRDKYYAFMKIVEDRRKVTGFIENPVRFTGYELLSSLGLKPTGSQYQEIDHWLTRMVSTTITSEWAVYLRGSRKFVRDTFHVFDRCSRRPGNGRRPHSRV